MKRLRSPGMWLALAFMALLAWVGYRTSAIQGETWQWVQHTHLVLESIDKVVLSSARMRALQRAFTLTGDREHLTLFADAAANLRIGESTLRALTVDNPAQQERLDRLAPILASYRTALDVAITARTEGGFVLEREAETVRTLRRIVDPLRFLLAELDRGERLLLAERDQAGTRSVTWAKVANIACSAAASLVIVLAFMSLWRENRRRLASELAARTSEHDLATILRSIGDGVIATDASGFVVRMNPVATRLTGWGDDAVGRPLAEVFRVIDEVTRTDQDPFARVLGAETATPMRGRWLLLRRDGRESPVADSGAPIRDDQGRFRGVVLVFHDVTDEREAARKIELAEARFACLFESGIVGIVVSDPQGTFKAANGAFQKMVGYSREELVEGAMNGDELTPPDLRDDNSVKRRLIADTGAMSLRERACLRKDGNRVPVLAGGALVPNGEYISFIADITDLKRAELELARSNAELEAFAYVASHDLQEPLRMVASYVQLIEKRYKGQLDADADKFIHYAVDGAKRMQELIADLLAYSRAGTRAKEPVPIDAGAALDRALVDLAPAIQSSGALVTHDLLPTVMGDAGQLAQVFQNLVGNALKFRQPDAHPVIHIGVERTDNEWRFSVKDDGIGIEPQYAERIFRVFQRLHNRSEYAGTGIGLSICKKIVERLHGRIWFESTPGAGSTFLFTLPPART